MPSIECRCQEFDATTDGLHLPSFRRNKAYVTDRMYKEFIDEVSQQRVSQKSSTWSTTTPTGANPLPGCGGIGEQKNTANNPYFNVDAPHPYSVFHDFNHESELVRTFVKRNLQFLLEEYNIDGFRFDLTKGFTQRSSNESTASNYDASRIAILKDYNKHQGGRSGSLGDPGAFCRRQGGDRALERWHDGMAQSQSRLLTGCNWLEE